MPNPDPTRIPKPDAQEKQMALAETGPPRTTKDPPRAARDRHMAGTLDYPVRQLWMIVIGT